MNERFKRLGHARRKLLLGLARRVRPVVMGKFGVPERRQRQAESRVHVRLARQAHRRAGVAVIGHLSGDDLGPLRLADRVPVVPGELDRGVVRFRARALEENPGHGHRRNFDELLGERDRRLVGAVAVEMVVAELAHLPVGDLGEPLRGKAERGAPQPRHRLDVVAPGIVEHAAAFAAGFLVCAASWMHAAAR